MKKIGTAVALLSLSLPVMVQAMEFQPIGTLGMGGAGVARNNGALTAYWNPAGGAFNTSPFAMNVGLGIGARGSDGLAENIDKFKDVDFKKLKDFSSTSDAKTVGDLVKAITILEDIERRKGNIALSGNVPIGFSIKRFSFGLYANGEGNILPKTDTMNLLPNNVSNSSSVVPITMTDLATAVGTQTPSSGYFTPTQQTDIIGQLQAGTGLSATQAQNIAYAIENQLINSGISADTAFASVTNTVIPTVKNSGSNANTFDKNTSSVMTKAMYYIEAPLSYGYPFDFGSKGQLGIGATAKIMRGEVFQNQILLVNRPNDENISSSNLLKELIKNSETSVNFGLDLGALYKYEKLTAGLVLKNLNSPKFNAPKYNVAEYNPVTKKVETTKMVDGEDVTIKPQARLGLAYDPFNWLSIASDIDLTENETVAPGTVVGSSTKSRNFGGGIELHPYSWLRLRGGAYKNLAASDIGLVLTGGFTVFMLDVDGAFATDTFKIGSTNLPQEVKVQVAMSFAF